jgi:hypothetical protein
MIKSKAREKRERRKWGRAGREKTTKTNLDTDFAVMLHALELLDTLLDDIALDQRSNHCCCCCNKRWPPSHKISHRNTQVATATQKEREDFSSKP